MTENPEKRHYRYSFKRHLDVEDIQDALTLAVCGAQGMHGRARVRVDGWWHLDRQRRICAIDGSTAVGEDISRLFAGHLSREFGESAFRVRSCGNARGKTRA